SALLMLKTYVPEPTILSQVHLRTGKNTQLKIIFCYFTWLNAIPTVFTEPTLFLIGGYTALHLQVKWYLLALPPVGMIVVSLEHLFICGGNVL
uniref:Uncharacterized protein n=1 Tax=Salvator merianae TaxID=96440 RepID=A0A8D0E0G7_SALMN